MIENDTKNFQTLAGFVKDRRKRLSLNQVELAEHAGVGLRFIRDLEQGKDSLRLDKVNQVLALFGSQMAPVDEKLMVTEHETG